MLSIKCNELQFEPIQLFIRQIDRPIIQQEKDPLTTIIFL